MLTGLLVGVGQLDERGLAEGVAEEQARADRPIGKPCWVKPGLSFSLVEEGRRRGAKLYHKRREKRVLLPSETVD